MKSEELIRNNALQKIEVAGKQKVVFEEIAITAVKLARKEEKKMARKVLESILDNVAPSLSDYILEEFKEKLSHGKSL